MKSPKVLLPGSKPYYKSNLLIQLIANRDHLKSIALEKEMEALCLDFEFPTIGYLTRYEWLAFIVAHVKRHTHQLEAMAHNNLQQQTTNSGI